MGVLQGRERTMAINATLVAASEIGIEDAVLKHAVDLSDTDQNSLKSLTGEEITALKAVSKKLPGMGIGEAGLFDTNNNNKA